MNRETLKKSLIESGCKNIPSDFQHTSQTLSILKEMKSEGFTFDGELDKAFNKVIGSLDYL